MISEQQYGCRACNGTGRRINAFCIGCGGTGTITVPDQSARIAELEGQLQRYHDLVRYQRGELQDAGLLTDEEYAAIAADSESPRRLEGYDQLREKLSAAAAETDIWKSVATLRVAELTAVRDKLAAAESEVAAVIHAMRPEDVIHVREGGGPENIFATLAVSVSSMKEKLKNSDSVHIVRASAANKQMAEELKSLRERELVVGVEDDFIDQVRVINDLRVENTDLKATVSQQSQDIGLLKGSNQLLKLEVDRLKFCISPGTGKTLIEAGRDRCDECEMKRITRLLLNDQSEHVCEKCGLRTSSEEAKQELADFGNFHLACIAEFEGRKNRGTA